MDNVEDLMNDRKVMGWEKQGGILRPDGIS